MKRALTLKPNGYATTVAINPECINTTSDATVFGWGQTKLRKLHGMDTRSKILKKLDVIIVSNEVCVKMFKIPPRTTQLCAFAESNPFSLERQYFSIVS